MKKIMFNDKYRLTDAVLNGFKTQTRRVAYTGEIKNPKTGFGIEGKDKGHMFLMDGCFTVAMSNYAIGETLAIAQSYNQALAYLLDEDRRNQEILKLRNKNNIGCKNKMFVKAELMPNHIRIKNIRLERLQDISECDCLTEGIIMHKIENNEVYSIPKVAGGYSDPRAAFKHLIGKVSGKKVWNNNPYVWVYEFEFID